MKKNLWIVLMLVGAVLAFLPMAAVASPNLVALAADEAAYAHATHAVEVSYKDLTLTTTNTAQVWTNPIPANTSVKCVGAKLVSAFDTGNTNGVLLVVGDTSGGTNFVNSVQLAQNSTPRYWKAGGTADTNGVVTSEVYYSAATNVYVSVTPSGSAAADNTRGKVRVYFDLR